MSNQDLDTLLKIDHESVWHPYSSLPSDLIHYPVKSANGVYLNLADDSQLIDGMASWWCAIHGYNHPSMNAALTQQIHELSHVMFGGLTHSPALKLARHLLDICPPSLKNIFYCDSGSVAVEVAMKMAIQYWAAQGQKKRRHFISLRQAYHGDTFAAMSVCDLTTGMHSLFQDILMKNFFIPRPSCRFGEPCTEEELHLLIKLLDDNQHTIIALIMEPIVQGAGGMWFYSAEYLKKVRHICDEYDIPLIFDEIATGFGRTGQLFACEHAAVEPDIMCIGKALTGGYLSLAATLCNSKIQNTIYHSEQKTFMHGPTFMANPLACCAAITSIELLLNSNWKQQIKRIETQLSHGLQKCQKLTSVKEVRVLGGIGVVELYKPVNMKIIMPKFIQAGVWIRPFGRLVYLMPPYIIDDDNLSILTNAIYEVINDLST